MSAQEDREVRVRRMKVKNSHHTSHKRNPDGSKLPKMEPYKRDHIRYDKYIEPEGEDIDDEEY